MKKIYIHLLLTSINGFFNKKQIPELYVQVQRHKAYLENKLKKAVSFEDAVFDWMENYFKPIMKIATSKELKCIYPQKNAAQIFFMITNRMNLFQIKDAKKIAALLIEKSESTAKDKVDKIFA